MKPIRTRLGWLRIPLAATLLVLPVWVVQTAPPAYACGCLAQPLEPRVARADLILVGTAAGVELGVSPTPSPAEPDSFIRFIPPVPSEVSIDVEQYIKGAGPDTVVAAQDAIHVKYGPDGDVEQIVASDCDTFDGPGDRYLLFLDRRDDGLYQSDVCAGSTQFFEWNEDDIAVTIDEIRQILAPTPTPTASATAPAVIEPAAGRSGGGFSPWLAAAAGGGGVILAGAALLAFRRTRGASPS